MNARVIWGHELPKEVWLASADRIEAAAHHIAEQIRGDNGDGRGEEAAEAFLADMQLAFTAMNYVADYARDKCRIIPI